MGGSRGDDDDRFGGSEGDDSSLESDEDTEDPSTFDLPDMVEEPSEPTSAPIAATFDDIESMLLALESKMVRMRTQDPIHRLKLEPGSDRAAIEAAFTRLSEEVHPDRFTHVANDEVHRLARDVYAMLADARGKLIEPAGPPTGTVTRSTTRSTTVTRATEAREGFARTTPPPLKKPTPRAASGSPHDAYKEAVQALKVGRYKDARDALEPLVKMDPRNRKFRVAHSLAVGKLSQQYGNLEQAVLHFERALELDPQCAPAKKELKRLRGEKPDGAARPFWERWFKKGEG